MGYEQLTQESLHLYVNQTDSLRTFLGMGKLDVREIGDGNLNYVYVVRGDDRVIIIKQALPYLRCMGQSWKLSRDRMLFEIAALEKFHELVPQHVPAIHHKDPTMSLVAIQYLADHIIMRKGLIESQTYPRFAEHAANFLAETLFKTSSYYLSSTAKRELEQKFNANHDLCKLTEDLVFTFPYFSHESNHRFPGMENLTDRIQSDNLFKSHILKLKYNFMNQRDALLHGDLHTGSIMVNAHETYIIDPEFAFFGPFGFDVGALLANLVLSFVAHLVCDKDDAYSSWLLRMTAEFLDRFEEKFLFYLRCQRNSALITPGYMTENDLEHYYRSVMQQIIQQSIGYAGCKIARRILGLAGVADIRGIKDSKLRLKAERIALCIAHSFVNHHEEVRGSYDLFELIDSAKQLESQINA